MLNNSENKYQLLISDSIKIRKKKVIKGFEKRNPSFAD